MIPEKIKNIMERLIKATESENLTWDHTSSETEFFVNFKNARITVDSWFNSETNENFVDLAIYNHNGLRIEYFLFEENNSPLEYLGILNLYKAINRKFLRAEETLDEILQELDDSDIPF